MFFNLYCNFQDMNTMKDFIKQFDFFEHVTFLRYQSEPSYRTLTGAIISIITIIIFIGLFSNMFLVVFSKNIITYSKNTFYDADPIYTGLKTDSQEKFMFAIGITGLELNNTQKRYFDISLYNYSIFKNGSRYNQTVKLNGCNISQWQGVNDEIYSLYSKIELNKWLCPPTGFVFPLQGKYTSNTFKYAKIVVQQCGTNGIMYNASTCASKSQISEFINKGVTLNFYFINPIINAGSQEYLKYYLEDANYFAFDAKLGVSANLYFSSFKISTDNSIFPWEDISEKEGTQTVNYASSQIYSVTSNNPYAKIYLRKASEGTAIQRNFAKIDVTLAYIGGLMGFILLFLTFLNLYSKFCYEIEFGDLLFKQNNNGSFGSENFNFIVFLGYAFFNILTKFGIKLNCKSMHRYHKCRIECAKQLDINLIFKKLQVFEEIGNIVLEKHHIQGLYMLPKKKIKQVQNIRRKYLLKDLIYYQLDRKARQVYVENEQYQKQYEYFFNQHHQLSPIPLREIEIQKYQKSAMQQAKKECSKSVQLLKRQSLKGQKYSRKIIDKIKVNEILIIEKQSSQHEISLKLQRQQSRNQRFPRLLSPLNSTYKQKILKNSKGIQSERLKNFSLKDLLNSLSPQKQPAQQPNNLIYQEQQLKQKK